MRRLLIGWILICFSLDASALRAATTPTTPPARFDPAAPGKSWVRDPAEFLSSRVDTRWIIGRSTRACVTDSEANDVACLHAAEQMMPLLAGRLRLGSRTDRSWLVERLHGDLMAGRYVRDRSLSTVHKPYGNVLSAAVLVDASAHQISQIAAEYESELRARQRTPGQRMFWVIALCGAILVVYALVNAVTKGYFQGRLRAGAYLGIVMLLVLLARIYCSAG